jgi:hypothetical protein
MFKSKFFLSTINLNRKMVNKILDKIGHARVRVVDGAKAGQKRHDRDANDAHATYALLNGEYAMLWTEYGKRVANLPE